MRQVKSCYREPITLNLTTTTITTLDAPLRTHCSDRLVRPSVNFDFDYKFHFDSIFPPDQRDQDRNQNWNQTLIQSISTTTKPNSTTATTKPNSTTTTTTKPSSTSRPNSTKPNSSTSNLLSSIWNQTTSHLKPTTNWNQITTLKPNSYSRHLPNMEQLSSSPPLSPPNLTNTTNTNPYPSSLSTLPHTNTTYNNSDSSSMKLDTTTPDHDQEQEQGFSPFRSPPSNPPPIVSPTSPSWPSPPRLSLLLSPERPVNYDRYQLERDYSEYDYVQFSEVYPPILYSKVSEDQFRSGIQRLNKIYRGGVTQPHTDVLHFLLDTVTCYTYRACCGLGKNSSWEKTLVDSYQLISELNESLFHPVGLTLVDPSETAFLFLEIATLP